MNVEKEEEVFSVTFNCTTPLDTKVELVIDEFFGADLQLQEYAVKGGEIKVD